jgi:hypothetical protein
VAAYLLDGRAIDLILALVAIEGCGILAWRAVTGRGPPAAIILPNLLAGASLLLALRIALTGAAPEAISVCLAAAFVAHGADLAGRWRKSSSASIANPERGGRPRNRLGAGSFRA